MLKLKHGPRAHPGSFKNLALFFVFTSLALLCLLTIDGATRKSAGKEEKKKPDGLEFELSEGGAKAAPEEAG